MEHRSESQTSEFSSPEQKRSWLEDVFDRDIARYGLSRKDVFRELVLRSESGRNKGAAHRALSEKSLSLQSTSKAVEMARLIAAERGFEDIDIRLPFVVVEDDAQARWIEAGELLRRHLPEQFFELLQDAENFSAGIRGRLRRRLGDQLERSLDSLVGGTEEE